MTTGMNILSIDTSTHAGSIAVLDGDALLSEISYQTKSGHSEVLIKEIEAALKKAKLKIESIDAFAVAIGPGSFTGLRIGLATAKGLALEGNRPILGISSLEALAYSLRSMKHEARSMNIVPCINAYRGEVYVATYNIVPHASCFLPQIMLNECSITPDALCDRLKDIEDELFFIGDGAIQYKDIFAQRLGNRFVLSKEKIFPIAGAAGLIAFKRLQKNERDELIRLIPNYIRKSDAETKAL